MRNILIAALLTIGGLLASIPAPTPAPPALKVVAPTPESIAQQRQAELKQKQYDRATVQVRRVLKARCGDEFANLIGMTAVDLHVNPRVLAALVYVESSCHATIVSHTHDVGLTQINLKVWRQYTLTQLLDPVVNVHVGATILAKCIHKYGLKEGLHAYNGFGNPTDAYATRVAAVAGIAL